MSLTHTLTFSWSSNNAGQITKSVAATGSTENNADEQVGAGTGAAVPLAWLSSRLQSIFVSADQTLTMTTNGTQQVSTATIVGTITGSGNANITATAAGMSGSPHTVPVAVTNGDSASAVAGKARAAMAADATITSFFAVGGTGANIVLTALTPSANDGTMNIASANGTCTGLTNEASSTSTTAGVAPQDTIAVQAGEPFVWFRGSGIAYPFAGNVSSTVFTNAGAAAANLSVKTLSA